MQKLQCDICGGTLVMDDSWDFAVCEACGMKFKRDTIKKMVVELDGPIRIDGSVQVEGIANVNNLAIRAQNFFNDNNFSKAKEYCDKILDLDANNEQALDILNKIRIRYICEHLKWPRLSRENFQNL